MSKAGWQVLGALGFGAMAVLLIGGGYDHGWGWMILFAAVCLIGWW